MPCIRIIDDKPQVCVKDRTLWARHHVAGPLIEALGEAKVDAIYEGVQADFWQDIAPDVAEEHGYGRDIYPAGRSGGWLELAKTFEFPDYIEENAVGWNMPDLDAIRERGTCGSCLARCYRGEECVCDDPDETDFEDVRDEFESAQAAVREFEQFKAFADAIDGAVKAAGEMFVQRLQEAVAEPDTKFVIEPDPDYVALIDATITALDKAAEYWINLISGLPQHAAEEQVYADAAEAVVALQDYWRTLRNVNENSSVS